MDQSSQFDDSNPFFSPLPPPAEAAAATGTSDASDALSLPPEATYPSKEALLDAIQAWAKPRGYAFTTSRSSKLRDKRQKLTLACDCNCAPPLNINRIRDSRSRGTGCLFSVVGIETSLGWEVRYRPESKFKFHNHLPSQSPAAHPSHRQLLDQVRDTARQLYLAGMYIYTTTTRL
jgi:hypothetical protein